MTPVEVAVANGAEKPAQPPVGMVTHLKHLIESLPVCVMRTDLEGCLLAVNDSALQLLGVAEHVKVLGKSLSERVSAEHVEEWRNFLRRGWDDGASSYECEMIDFMGTHRVVLVKAVAQPPHADAIQSLILTAQDVASRRRLERALNDHQGCAATIGTLQSELQLSETERQRLVVLVETLQSGSSPSPEEQAALESLNQQLAEIETALAAKTQELEQRNAEHQQLTAMLAQRDAERQAAGETLQRRIAELERTLATNEEEWRTRCDALTAQTAAHAATNEQLVGRLEQLDNEHQRLLEDRQAEHRHLLAERDADRLAAGESLQRIGDLEQSLSAKDAEWQKHCDELTAKTREHAARVEELAGLLKQRQAEYQRSLEQRDANHSAAGESLKQRIAELEQSLSMSEAEWQTRRDELMAQTREHAARVEELGGLLKQRQAEYQRSLEQRDADHSAAGESLKQRITDLEQSLSMNDGEWQRRCEELTARSAEHVAQIEQRSRQIAALHDEQRRLLEQHEADRHVAGEMLQKRIDELEGSLLAREAEWQKRAEALTAQLANMSAERHRLAGLVEERDAEQHRLVNELERRDGEQHRLANELERRDADHATAGERLQQRISELEHSVITNNEEWRQRCEDLTARLADLTGERERLSGLLEQGEIDRQATDGLQQRIDELERTLSTNETEWQKRRADLTAEIDRHVTEQQRVSALLKEREGEERRMFELLQDGDVEQQRLSALIKVHETEQQRLAQILQQRDDQHQTALDGLRQQIEECEHALTTNDDSWKQRCEELSNQLTAKDDEGRARCDQLNAELIEHTNQQQRLSKLLEQHEAEQERLITAHAAERIQIEQAVRGECAHVHAEADQRRRREIETLRLEMRQLAEDLQQTAADLAQRTVEYERLTEESRARDEEAIDPEDMQRLIKSVAAYRVELVEVTENTIRTLEPMATAGRVAIASSRELQSAVEAVDQRSKQLLTQCALDDPNRPEIELMRRDAIGAASLVRQLIQVFGETHGALRQG